MTSSSDPGRSGALSPYNDMKSLYFDDSLYENEMHYKIAQILDSDPLKDDYDELVIKCDSEEEYNSVLDALYHFQNGKIKVYGVSSEPNELIVEKDPREGYRKFDEDTFLMKENSSDDQ